MTTWDDISQDLLPRFSSGKSQLLLPDCLSQKPRLPLANLPTPLQTARRLTQRLAGPEILIKRDDLTGLATGGNKTRKLEFLLADALNQNAGCLITVGGPQSNHCRQTAAAAARIGLPCHLVIGGFPPPHLQGNLFLDRVLGTQMHWSGTTNRTQKIEEVAASLRSAGATPYTIPVGGSTAIGALGYVVAMVELCDQLAAANRSVDRILFATSSGGTQAGIVVGAALTGFTGQVLGISIDQVPDEQSSVKYKQFVTQLANDTAQSIGCTAQFSPKDININYDYLGQGYGVVGDLEREAVKLMAQTEGILVGPVYTGRALGGLIDLIRKGIVSANETILFWHTGDETALHAYTHEFAEA